MLRRTKEWDVRCPRKLSRLFPVRRGYYYKVDRRMAQRICNVLSRAYHVAPPTVLEDKPEPGCNGQYCRGQIWVHGRAHIKTVFHEWYHHLDWATRGRYNSSDRGGGSSSLAWQFADRLFEVFRHAPF